MRVQETLMDLWGRHADFPIRAALVAVMVALTPACPWAQVSTTAGSGNATLVGTVRDANLGSPIRYAIVEVVRQHARVLTDANGAFRIQGLSPGSIQVSVRRIGYRPRAVSVQLARGRTGTVDVGLAPLALALAPYRVRATGGCDAPGAGIREADSVVAQVFEQVRENALTYRLFAMVYPFILRLDRRTVVTAHDGSTDEVLHDTVALDGGGVWRYRPGHVVDAAPNPQPVRGGAMHIPTLANFADSTFLASHCFYDAGVVHRDSQPLLRVDFRADRHIEGPDVDGSIYLDTASFQIREDVVRLTRAPPTMPWLASAEVTTWFDGALPEIATIARIRSRNVWHFNRPEAPREQVETQNRIGIAFSSPRSAHAVSRQDREQLVDIRVTDSTSGTPLSSVAVLRLRGDTAVTTDARGSARVFLRAGAVDTLRLRRIGYAPLELAAQVDGHVSPTPVPVRIAMQRTVALDTVRITAIVRRYLSPGLIGFQARERTAAAGYFIGDSVLRESEGRRLGDLFRSRIPGAVLVDGPHGSVYLMRSPHCAAGGPPQVYLDGVPLPAQPLVDPANPPSGSTRGPSTRRAQMAAIPPFDLSTFQVGDLAGVEYYPDNDVAPVQFAPTSQRCGVVLLWTRER